MDSSVVFPRKLTKRFIAMYKDLPCLWDNKCYTYKHRKKRLEAISKLTTLVQEYDPAATRVHVLRKIESLRACIRREHKKVVESRRRARTPDEIYVPTLWYYDLFSFFFRDEGPSGNVQVRCVGTQSDEVADSSDDDDINPEHDFTEDEEINADDDVNDDSEVASCITTVEDQISPEQDINITYVHQPSYSEYNGMVEVIEPPPAPCRNYEEEHSKIKRSCSEVGDEYDAIGINVAAKLRTLPPGMRILAEKLINDVLFQAQVNALNTNTVIVTTDPFKQIIM